MNKSILWLQQQPRVAPVQRGDCFIRLPKYSPLAKSSLSLGFVRPMVFTDEQLQLIWWSSNYEDQWSKMLPLEIILFSIADIYYYKALCSIVIYYLHLTKKFCWSLCNLSLKLWKVKDERWEVCKVEIVWASGIGSIRAGLGVSKEVWGRPGTTVPGLYWGCWIHPGAPVMAAAHIYLQAVLKIECLYVVHIWYSQFDRASFLILFSWVMNFFLCIMLWNKRLHDLFFYYMVKFYIKLHFYHSVLFSLCCL